MVDLLRSTVMPYAWGSRTAIAELTGRTAPTGPEAELWMGAHPMAPSKVARDGAPERALDTIIEADPTGELGAASLAAFGPRLPFLLKVLAADAPLSLQAHPHADRARAGFDDEERRGIARDAPSRNYRDPSHKPELLCALAPFDALCGFRRAGDTIALFDSLAVPELDPVLAPLRDARDRSGLAATFRAIMTMPDAARAVDALVARCAAPRASDAFAEERALAVRLAALYPGDVGIVSALLLNHLHLAPGEAIYLDAGNLHAYLGGVGVEIMASSDNVLRGGLTKKHVDVPELVRILDFEDGPVTPRTPRAIDEHEKVYDTPAREFRLSVIEPRGAKITRVTSGPEIVLATAGALVLQPRSGPTVELARGAAAFVPASTGSYALSGTGVVYRAAVNL
jgi:mannose-6-phosphate isomerase